MIHGSPPTTQNSEFSVVFNENSKFLVVLMQYLIFSCYDLIFSCLQRGGKMKNRYPWKGVLSEWLTDWFMVVDSRLGWVKMNIARSKQSKKIQNTMMKKSLEYIFSPITMKLNGVRSAAGLLQYYNEPFNKWLKFDIKFYILT